MKQKEINQRWLTQRQEHLVDIQLEVSTYPSDVVRHLMRTALLFWKFVREILRQEYSEEQRNEFLLQCTKLENKYIVLIAKIEMLPLRVWRKSLWRYNLDFMSFESFLRRITPEQQKLVHLNWIDVCIKNRKARALNYRLVDKFLLFIYAILQIFGLRNYLEKGSARIYNDRYVSKAAWSDNLAFLDFGFGMYVDGTSSDKKNLSSKASRFLSVKTHVNDFVVNQEDGVYWFFYKFRRSFGALRKMSSVRLSSWICPGFWMTLSVMAWFLLGPVIGLMTVDYSSIISFPTILSMVLAAPFVLWLTIHLLINILHLLADLVILIADSFEDVNFKWNKKLGDALLKLLRPVWYIASLLAVIFLITQIWEIFVVLKDWINSLFLEIQLFPPYIGTIVISGGLLYLLGALLHWFAYEQDSDNGKLSTNMIESGWVRKSFLLNLILWIIVPVMFFREPIWSGISWLGETIWSGLTWFGSFLFENGLPLVLLITIVISIVYVINNSLFSDDEKFYKNKRKSYLAMIAGIIAIALFIGIPSVEGAIIAGVIVVSPVIILLFGFFILTLLLSTTRRSFVVNKNVIEKKKEVADSIHSTRFLHGEKNFYSTSKFYQKLLAQNKNVSKNDVSYFFSRLTGIAYNLSLGSLSISFLGSVLRTATLERVRKLHRLVKSEREYRYVGENLSTRKELAMFAKLFLKGNSKKEAVKLTKEFFGKKYESKKRFNRRINKILISIAWISAPFVLIFGLLWEIISVIYNIIAWVVRGLVKIIVNLYRFGKIMSKEACPYVGEQKYLG